MAVLGKRKVPSEPATPDFDANDLLRRHFEARFQPLSDEPSAPTDKADDSEAQDQDQDSEWDGLSDADDQRSVGDDDSPTIEVVDYSKPQLPRATIMTRRESKAFMSSRPPDQTMAKITAAEPSTPSAAPSVPEDAPSLLKQDLELRRLLAESHLLAPHAAAAKSLSSVSSNVAQPKSFALGRTRQKATDLRVQALGSKLSIHKQEKMPMHMRKGMTAAAEAREAKRRREAKENGIILERETGKKKRRKERGGHGGGVDRPGVGRLKGAELRISERDVRGIEASRDAFGRKGRR